MSTDPRHRAWNDIHALLPEGWQVGPVTYDPGSHAWTVAARSPKPVGRGSRPEYLEGRGEDELAALTYLALALREKKDAATLAELRTKGRLAYLEGAEERSRQMTGRGLTGEELARVIERFPGR